MPDTASYLEFFQTFHLWKGAAIQWARTPPFPFVLGIASYFPEPTAAIYWFHSLLFSAGITSLSWMMAGLFQSAKKGILFGCTLLLMEVLTMHSFAYNLFLLSDPLYIWLILIGSTMILGGWIWQRSVLVCVGFFLLGMAVLTRPAGLSLFPLWILFAVLLGGRTPRNAAPVYTMRMSALCIALLLAPTALWSAHNAVLYGNFRMTAFGARNLLPHVLFLVGDNDQLLDDPVQNKQFIDHIRAFGQTFGTNEDTYRWQQSDAMPNIFSTLTSFLHPGTTGLQSEAAYVRETFALDRFATRIATRIILLHPVGYAQMVRDNYYALVSPALIAIDAKKDTADFYKETITGVVEIVRTTFFPPSGTIDPARISPLMTTVVRQTALSPQLLSLRSGMRTFFPAFVHILLILSFVFAWRRPRTLENSLPFSLQKSSVIIVMLLGTSLSNYLFSSLLEESVERYGLPGETGLHAGLLLGMVTTVCVLIFFVRSALSRHD